MYSTEIMDTILNNQDKIKKYTEFKSSLFI